MQDLRRHDTDDTAVGIAGGSDPRDTDAVAIVVLPLGRPLPHESHAIPEVSLEV